MTPPEFFRRALALLLLAAPLLARSAPPRVAVLPFDVSNTDERYAPLAEGLANEFAERLAWNGAEVYDPAALEDISDEAGIADPESLSLASQRELARRAHADYFLSGAVSGEGEFARISLRLIAVARPLAPVRVEEKIGWDGLPSFLARVERQLAAPLGLPPRHEGGEPSSGALELYLRAGGDLPAAARIGYLQTALETAPDFIRARVRLTAALLDDQKIAAAESAFAPLDAMLGLPSAPGPLTGRAGARLALLKGRLELQLGRSLSADSWTRRALQAAPDAAGFVQLARIKLALNDFASADAAVTSALALAPQDDAALRLRDRISAARDKAASAPHARSAPAYAPAPPPGMTAAPAPRSASAPRR